MLRISEEAYKDLIQQVNKEEDKLIKIRESKAVAASTMDCWHDEQFKTKMLEEGQAVDRIARLRETINSAERHSPACKTKIVEVGIFVDIMFEGDKDVERFWFDGIAFKVGDYTTITTSSPMGKKLCGKKEGDSFAITATQKKATIVKIIGPENS